jgi:hypothetical protein
LSSTRWSRNRGTALQPDIFAAPNVTVVAGVSPAARPPSQACRLPPQIARGQVTPATTFQAGSQPHYGVGRGCGVGRALGVALGVAVGETVAVAVGVAVGVTLAVAVGVAVGVTLGVGVAVAVAVAVAVGVGVGVPSAHGVTVGVGVGGGGVGVGGGAPTAVAILTRPQPYTLFGGVGLPHWASWI